MRFSLLASPALLVGLLTIPAMAQDATPAPAFTDSQKAAIEDVVRNLLTEKEPELVFKAAEIMQKRQQDQQLASSQKAVSDNKEKLYNDPTSPVLGNPKGDVTIVEFFDYRCGYCKMAHEAVKKLLSEDKNVRYISKEFPILGPDSVTASKAALASVKQNKYAQFNSALLTLKAPLTEDLLFSTAKDVGLDVEKLKKDMQDPAIDAAIKANIELGQEIGARGTPTFIFGEQLFPGAIPLEQMKATIAEMRSKQKK